MEIAKSARLRYIQQSRSFQNASRLSPLQCDESKPMCNRCQVYGTFCNYDPQYSDLQPLEHGSGGILILQPSVSLENRLLFGSIDLDGSQKQMFSPATFAGEYRFSTEDFELLHLFESRTLPTFGTGRNREVYQDAFKTLAQSVCLAPQPFAATV